MMTELNATARARRVLCQRFGWHRWGPPVLIRSVRTDIESGWSERRCLVCGRRK